MPEDRIVLPQKHSVPYSTPAYEKPKESQNWIHFNSLMSSAAVFLLASARDCKSQHRGATVGTEGTYANVIGRTRDITANISVLTHVFVAVLTSSFQGGHS